MYSMRNMHRLNMNRYNGDRLRLARLYNGYTIDELAKKVGITAQAESQYEIGKIVPQFDKMLSLSEVLNFPVQYFLKGEDLGIVSGSSYFRSLMKTPKKYRTEQKTKVEFLAKLYSVLDDYVEFPKLNLPNEVEEYETPQEAADYLRCYWNLSDKPITNMLRLLEAQGIIVTSFETHTPDIDAFSQFFKSSEKSFYIVAYSNNKNSAARINFDLAHELGHIMLHTWSDDIENITREEFKAKEKAANDFAAAFLMPADSFSNDIRFYSSEIQYYIELKKKWHVSIAAMLHRACELTMISQNQYQNAMRNMNAKKIRINEPLDNILEIPYPRILKDSVDLLITNEVFTKRSLLEEFADAGLPMNANEVEKLLALGKGYFNELEEKNDFSPVVLRLNK